MSDVNRREVIEGAALGIIVAVMPVSDASAAPAAGTTTALDLAINGRDHTLSLDPRTTLLDALREHVGLTGTKKGCDHGQCGACTVIVEGRRINSCLKLAVRPF